MEFKQLLLHGTFGQNIIHGRSACTVPQEHLKVWKISISITYKNKNKILRVIF